MKTAERHQLKHNEVADSLQQVYTRLDASRRTLVAVVIAVVVLGAAIAGWSYFRGSQDAAAGTLLAEGLVVTEAQVVAPTPQLPGQPAPPPPPAGSYPSEKAKLEAALPKFLAAADTYPNTSSGLSARGRAASALASIGRRDDARVQYQKLADADPRGLYGRTARLALADLDVQEKKYDAAITTLREFSLDAKGDLPLDAILMQLGQAYLAAGKTTDARQTFERLTNEFATSAYAADAKKQLETLKPGA